MAGSTRIKGSALALSFGATDYWADVTSVTMENEEVDGGALTFADAASAGVNRQYKFTGSAIQSLQTTSFWRYAWEHVGDTVAFRYAPKGNPVASADEPHFLGSVKIGARPSVGGEASTSGNFTFDFEWLIEGEPTLDLGVGGAPFITTISPAGQSAGDQVLISGSRFDAVTDVKFGTTSVPSLVVVSDTTLAVIVPTGAAGVKAVTAISPAGTSEPVNYTVAS